MALVTSYWTTDLALVLSSILIAAYFYMTRKFGYWKNRGVLELKPTPFVGNFADCCLLRTSLTEFFKDLYDQGKGLPYLGFYLFDKPSLLIRDPGLIKNVLIKDFHYFWDRHCSADEADIMGNENLFFIKNPAWKIMRQHLTSVFSSGKMKGMLPLMDAVGDDLVTYLKSLEAEGDAPTIELRETFANYTMDIIGSCVYGLKVNCLNNPDAEFRKRGRTIFESSYSRALELMSIFFVPELIKPLGFSVFGAKAVPFLRKVLNETFDERVKSGLRRNDLIDLLIDLKNSQTNSNDPNMIKLEGDSMVAQAAIFFSAGFETSSALMSFTLHELSLHPEIQTKLREEITSALAANGDVISYDMLQGLSYLDRIVSEGLRKYPALPFLDRVTIHDYAVPSTGLVIEKGTPIYIPMLGLHYDPEYHPDPEKFDPERFTEENRKKIPPLAYLPFGDGPHRCIGVKFGLMQVKIGIVKVIANYELTPCEKTPRRMSFDPRTLIASSRAGLYHRIRRIRSDASRRV